MSVEIKLNIKVLEGLKRGVDKLASAVKVTMGGKGRNVVYNDELGRTAVTKDGVTVAEQIFLKDPLENMGAQMVKEVASKTNDLAGDGTTTATVLAQAIVKEGFKNVAAGANPMDLKKGIDKAVQAMIVDLEKQSKPASNLSKIRQIATISANNDETIGKLFMDAYKRVGKNGIITVEESKGIETYVDVSEGIKIDRGYLSPEFITNPEKKEVELENPLVLYCSDEITNIQQLVPVLDFANSISKAVLIITDDISAEVLEIVAYNKSRGALKVAVIKAPGFGDSRRELTEDLAIITGGTIFKASEIINFKPEMLGIVQKVTITKDTTVIINNDADKELISTRIDFLTSQLESEDSDFDKETIKKRIASLINGVAVIHVGAASEVEMKEKKERVDDALHAVNAAVAEGIVEGGGLALLKARIVLSKVKYLSDDEKIGVDIVYRAMEAPLKTIAENAGVSGDVVLAEVLKNLKKGYNVKTDEYVDMFRAGIIDPRKVTRVALENAASVAGMILTTECALIPTENE